VIAFIFEVLSREEFQDVAEFVHLMSPAVSYMCSMLEPAELAVMLEELDLPTKQLIAFPLNDSTNADAANSGSHWAVLLYSQGQFELHDSIAANGAMLAVARRMSAKLHAAFGLGKGGGGDDDGAGNVTVQTPTSPQQHNGYDCGAFVVAVVRHFCSQFLAGRARDAGGPLLLRDVTQDTVEEQRLEFKHIVQKMCNAP
jgi:sentrin-specific protease 8